MEAGPGAQKDDQIVGVQDRFARLLLGVGDGAHDADHGHDQHSRHYNPLANAHDCCSNGERDGGREHGVGEAVTFQQQEIEADGHGAGASGAPGQAGPKLRGEGRAAPDGCLGEERQPGPPSIRTVLAHRMLLPASPTPPPVKGR